MKSTETKIKWHRFFGLTLIDYFTDSNYEVELEKELSVKQQYLDIAIIKKISGTALEEKADGLEDMAEHNLMTYKSLREPLDDWAIEELIGYYSNYRKVVIPSLNKLLPTSYFKLYAICTRYPSKLFNDNVIFKEKQKGVYDLTWGSRIIRVLVLSRIAIETQNAIWQLFSGKTTGFIFGNQNYKWRCPEEQAILNQLFTFYKQKGVKMSYTMADFTKDFVRENLHVLPPSDRLQDLAPRDRLEGLAPSDRLQGLSATEIKEYLSQLNSEKKKS